RSACVWEGTREPVHVVQRRVELPIAHLDWRDLSDGAQRARLDELLRTERQRGFVLTRAPLMRLTVIQLAAGAWQVVWTYHHLVLDGWSTSLVLQHMAAA